MRGVLWAKVGVSGDWIGRYAFATRWEGGITGRRRQMTEAGETNILPSPKMGLAKFRRTLTGVLRSVTPRRPTCPEHFPGVEYFLSAFKGGNL